MLGSLELPNWLLQSSLYLRTNDVLIVGCCCLFYQSGLETAASIKVSVQLCVSIMYMYVCVIFSAISLHV